MSGTESGEDFDEKTPVLSEKQTTTEDEKDGEAEDSKSQETDKNQNTEERVKLYDRRPSKNIYNLKLNIPKPGFNTIKGEIQTASVATKLIDRPVKVNMYERSQSTTSHQPATRRPTSAQHRSRQQHFQRQSSILQRAAMIRSGSRRVKEATESFVGIGKNCESDSEKWRLRHLRYCSLKYGKLKPQQEAELEEQETMQNSQPTSPTGYLPQIIDPLSRGRSSRFYAPSMFTSMQTPEAISGLSFGGSTMGGGPIAVSTPPRTPNTPGARSLGGSSRYGHTMSMQMRRAAMKNRKESVARMSWKVVSSVVRGTSVMKDLVGESEIPDKRSFGLPSLAEEDQETAEDIDTSFFTQMPTIAENESIVDEVFFDQATEQPTTFARKIEPEEEERRGKRIGVNRVLSYAFRQDKRQYGQGLVGRWLNRRMTRKRLNSSVRRQLDTFDDHRPYFSYWVTSVNVIVCIISLCVYGIAPIGFTNFEDQFMTTKKSLSRIREDFSEPQNFWIGPRTKDLIHLGAKYSPCMRQDANLHKYIQKQRAEEKLSACCVRNDKSGCIQTSKAECSSTFSTFVKWPDFDPPSYTNESVLHDRHSGSVCGQDPRFCHSHVPGQADEWPDDISKWPICPDKITPGNNTHTPYDHMTCEVVGHPCCIGQEARCEIVTEEYCQKKRGVFHPEASLCSQISCLQDTCGLIEFRDPNYPDQIYRMWLSIFLHAGILHCIVSIVFQMTVVRDMEKLAGWARICIIYIFSGMAGNLASAIFLPYRAEVGPAGSHFGILACLFVEIIQSWQLLRSPLHALFKLVAITGVLFLFGMLPWIDNFAHIFGFLSGLLLSFVFLPYITFNEFDKKKKRLLVITCAILFLAMFTTLIIFFYVKPVADCVACRYLNCIPFTSDFCSNHGFQPEDKLS